jgi:MFS family permease
VDGRQGHPSLRENDIYDKVSRRLIPFLFGCYIIAFLDRVNVGFAKLQMASDLGFSDAMYGFGAGVFFIGYFVFEVPSNVILARVGARLWIARIMITWGVVSSAFMFTGAIRWGPVAPALGCTDAELTFYVLRFLLGLAEAGFFPGIILYLTYWFPSARRARAVALFMTAIAISNVIGGPISGAIMQFMDGVHGWRGWQWLFLVEGAPAVIAGALVFTLLPDGPASAGWLTPPQRDLILQNIGDDETHKRSRSHAHRLADAFRDLRVWALTVPYFSAAVCVYAANFWMPTIVQELTAGNAGAFRIGLMSAIPWAVAAVAMVWWASHSDRTGERRWHVAAGFLVACAGWVLLAVAAASATVSVAGLTLVTVGVLSALATFWSIPTAFLSCTAAAAGIALINSVGNLGGHVGPDLIGRVRTMSAGSSETAFLVVAGITLVGACVVLALPGRPK